MCTRSPAIVTVLAAACLLAACEPSRSGDPSLPDEALSQTAFDSVRGVTVLFGARDSRKDGETWEWDGSTWTLRATSGPSPREGHALAFDSARGVTVLFGGFVGSGVLSDETWEWDGTAWTLVATGGPSGRYSHAMAYDATNGVTVLLGGRTGDGQLNNETWLWDGTVWTQGFTSFSLTPRSRHALAFDSARGVTVLFGGFDGGYLDDTWEWNGFSWTQADTPEQPSPRFFHAAAFDSARGVIVLYGGFEKGPENERTYVGETWEYDGTAWALAAAPEPPARATHSLAFDSARGVSVLSGGFDGRHLEETWEWDGASWTLRPETSGPPVAVRILGFAVNDGRAPSGPADGVDLPAPFELVTDGRRMIWRTELR